MEKPWLVLGAHVRSAFKEIQGDTREKHTPVHKINHNVIIDHIESYNTTISHYRRNQAPNRHYLPHDVTLRKMHQIFQENVDESVAYNTYYQIFKAQNILFTRLAHEKCELCSEFDLHKAKCNYEIECFNYYRLKEHQGCGTSMLSGGC